MVRAKIDAAYADSVKFTPEVDAFDEAISAAVKVSRCVLFCFLNLSVCLSVVMDGVYMGGGVYVSERECLWRRVLLWLWWWWWLLLFLHSREARMRLTNTISAAVKVSR
jgi:hypothetical protein